MSSGSRLVSDRLVIPRVLVADGQLDIVEAIRLVLKDVGIEADSANSVQGVRDRLAAGRYDLLLMDLDYARDTTSGREGLELLAEVHARDRLLPVIVMTGLRDRGRLGTRIGFRRRLL